MKPGPSIMHPTTRTELLGSLPAPAPVVAAPPARKLIVLDDDPTGTQTVHDVPVLTSWTVAELAAELRDSTPCCYILTNSRAFGPEKAVRINREIGRNLASARRETGIDFSVISRGDSTLRGHYPVETDALIQAMGDRCDATLIVPAFLAGGRITVGNIHYVADEDRCTPVGATEFARDPNFGFAASDLRAWVEEKSGGRIPAASVRSISIEDIRVGGSAAVAAILASSSPGGVIVANAAAAGDFSVLAAACREAERAGRRFLYRTAADFVAAFAGLTSRPLLRADELIDSRGRGGLLVAGSHVGRTRRQLELLIAGVETLVPVQLDLAALLEPAGRELEEQRCARAVATALGAGRSAVLFRSGELVQGRDAARTMALGEIIAGSLVRIVRDLPVRPGWLVAKGGITSSDIATSALGIRRAIVAGQALPGVPVWRAGAESKWPGLPYIVFPGNVGRPEALGDLVGRLEAAAAS